MLSVSHINNVYPQVPICDGYKCVATGFWSRNHDNTHLPASITREAVRYMQGAHILRRAVVVSKTECQNKTGVSNLSFITPRPLSSHAKYLASVTTWGILRHYGALSDKMIQKVDRWVDGAENGITLSIDALRQFQVVFCSY
jgi:hypothetical protein